MTKQFPLDMNQKTLAEILRSRGLSVGAGKRFWVIAAYFNHNLTVHPFCLITN
ncbi:hypothetical protein [Vulcanococcus limneticus]|uniref:hypothetical protein n=1 Tax=Vulcanococcus limneticus TaxID=2170428 RepID=UPI0018E304B6|nr:hypothetical protein [Vulcanococcus limneticus]